MNLSCVPSIIMMMVLAIMTHIELQEHYTSKVIPNYAFGRLGKQAEMMNACASSCNHG